MAYKCCTHCDALRAVAWENKKIKIEDWYDRTSLGDRQVKAFEGGYQGCSLKNIELIVQQGRGRRVYRRRRVLVEDNGDGVGDNETRMELDEGYTVFEGERMDVDSL